MENGQWNVDIEDIEHEESLKFNFEGEIKELEGCKISAKLEFQSMGDFIQVIGHVEGNITLEWL